MPEELCQVSPKSHYVSLALHSDPSPLFHVRGENLFDKNVLQVKSFL